MLFHQSWEASAATWYGMVYQRVFILETVLGLEKAVFFGGFNNSFILVTKSFSKKCSASGYASASRLLKSWMNMHESGVVRGITTR